MNLNHMACSVLHKLNLTIISSQCIEADIYCCQVMTEADLGLADSYINGDFSFVDKDEGLLNLFLVR